MPTTPINALRSPALSDNPNGPLAVQNIAEDLDDRLVPAFTSGANRDATITSPTTGMVCAVAGIMQIYRAGAWRGMFSVPYRDVTVLSTPQTASADILSIAIADPGFPYMLHMSGAALVSVDSGVTVDPQLQVNGATVLQGASMVAGASKLASVPAAMSDVTTGPATVAFRIFKSSGAAGSGYTATGTPNVYTQLFAQVIPA